MLAVITGGVFILLGAILLFSGVKLAALGGSWFYLVISLGLVVSGIQLIRKRRSALTIYALLLVLTLIWTIAEVGFDKWQWIPRGAMLAVLGLWLAMPFVSRPLRSANEDAPPPLWTGSHRWLSGVIVVLAAITVVISFFDAFPTRGELPNEVRGDLPEIPDLPGDDWKVYSGSLYGQRYSTLKDITPENAHKLKLAWEFKTGDLRQPDDAKEYTFESVPLKVNNSVYICTPHNAVISLDPTTGKERWRFTPEQERSNQRQHQTCRGVSYHDVAVDAVRPEQKAAAALLASTNGVCSKRIVAPLVDGRLMALDANTGKLCADFGKDGYINLLEGQPHLDLIANAYMLTSPATIASGVAVVGGGLVDNGDVRNPSGVIRAYDVLTGQLIWKFDAGKPESTAPLAPGEMYEAGSPNSWTVFTADTKLGLIYVPLGNRSPDQIGTNRSANDEKYTDAVVALDLATGQDRWSFRTSYHDVWDRDNPTHGVLIDLKVNGENVPAILQATKGGNIFVLDRRNGQPVMPVTEVPVATDTNVPGEVLSPVQPMSALNLTPPPLEESDMWGISPFDQLACRIAFKSRRYDHNMFTPLQVDKNVIIYPGNVGSFNWGGVAVDPIRQVMIAAPNRLAYDYGFVAREDYQENPRRHVMGGTDKDPEWNENFGGPYAAVVKHFRSGLGFPCQAPPWGVMSGVDLTTGKTVWSRRHGTVHNQNVPFLPFPFPVAFPMGMLAHGGTLMTAGGVSFTAASVDNHFRAYNISTGEKIWDIELPASGQSTPVTYRGEDGKQYIVLSAGGHGSLGSTPGDSVVAYTLED
jgi:quinoprotein glucose dehydrogenase